MSTNPQQTVPAASKLKVVRIMLNKGPMPDILKDISSISSTKYAANDCDRSEKMSAQVELSAAAGSVHSPVIKRLRPCRRPATRLDSGDHVSVALLQSGRANCTELTYKVSSCSAQPVNQTSRKVDRKSRKQSTRNNMTDCSVTVVETVSDLVNCTSQTVEMQRHRCNKRASTVEEDDLVVLDKRLAKQQRLTPAQVLASGPVPLPVPAAGGRVARTSHHDNTQPTSSEHSDDVGIGMSHRRQCSRVVVNIESTVSSDVADAAGLTRFTAVVKSIFHTARDLDVNVHVTAADEDSNSEGEAVFMPSPVTKLQLRDIKLEAAKLKLAAASNKVGGPTLVRLLKTLLPSIGNGCTLIQQIDIDADDTDEDQQMWLQKMDTLVLPACDAACGALCIMTSAEMPKEVFLEDVIEWIVKLVKTHLFAVVYPLYSSLKDDRSRPNLSETKKHVTVLYNMLTELMSLLAELVNIQQLTDDMLLQISMAAVSPFFVEDVCELQLSALELISAVFGRYETHRQSILEDILSSLASLPSNKKNMRTYRLSAGRTVNSAETGVSTGDNVQMVSALVLQLIQSVIKLPNIDSMQSIQASDKKAMQSVIMKSFDASMVTAHKFLSVFLSHCTSPKGKGEDDYRPLFDNFVNDLLTMSTRAEWPAAKLVLSILRGLLVKQSGTKTNEMSARVAALDYLGTVAARLRKDYVASVGEQDAIETIVAQVVVGNEAGLTTVDTEEKVRLLQKSLIDYLLHDTQQNPSVMFSVRFYLAMWFRDCTVELTQGSSQTTAAKVNNKHKKPKNKKPRYAATTGVDDDSDDESMVADEDVERDVGLDSEAERTQMFVLSEIQSLHRCCNTTSWLSYEQAALVSKFLSSQQATTPSFDCYLSVILEMLVEKAIQVRTKALKCLMSVIEVDPSVLARSDVQVYVHHRFTDESISVREAAIDLVGRFLIVQPALTAQYYKMLSDRILDSGVSVRKRVIKIFREICVHQPSFDKVPEMCVKMICRVNDEEGVKKLVLETFQLLWFNVVNILSADGNTELTNRVKTVIDVMSLLRDVGYDWFEELLQDLLKSEKEKKDKPIERSCAQLVDCLVDTLTANSGLSSCELACCSTALYILCKCRPSLLTKHCVVLEPFLCIARTCADEQLLIHNIVRIMELGVPLMSEPSDSFLQSLESNITKLLLQSSIAIVQSCSSCLSSIVNGVTRNFKLVRDCFAQFYDEVLNAFSHDNNNNNNIKHLQQNINNCVKLKRALYTVGVLCRHFDLNDIGLQMNSDQLLDSVYQMFLHFIGSQLPDVSRQALMGFGFLCVRHSELMLTKPVRELYQQLLTQRTDSINDIKLFIIMLGNLRTYLVEEEHKMTQAEAEWKKIHGTEDLKEMHDLQSGMASTVVQAYLKEILDSYLHVDVQVRHCATDVVVLILRQGLVNPLQCIPHVVAMASDCDSDVRTKAEQQLQDINKKNPSFIQVKSTQGMKLSYKLHKLLQCQMFGLSTTRPAASSAANLLSNSEPLRGLRLVNNIETAVNASVYLLTRVNRTHRRGLLTSLLKMFDDDVVELSELVFISDNLAHFAYQQQDEPLFVMHQIDITVSVSGSHILDAFNEIFHPKSAESKTKKDGDNTDDDDDCDDIETLISCVGATNTSLLWELYVASHRYMLLLMLKQYLKELFGFTDSKVQQYSPAAAAKVYNNALNRKQGVKFVPRQTLALIQQPHCPSRFTEHDKSKLVHAYLEFKHQMSCIDRGDIEAVEPASEVDTSGSGVGCGDVEPADVEPTDRQQDVDVPAVVVKSSRGGKPASVRRPSATAERKQRQSKPKRNTRKKRKQQDDSDDDGSDADWN